MSIAAPATNPASDLSIKLPATIGSAGQVLKNSDTAGTLEFGPPPRPYRNLIINGAMNVAQRGTSSTDEGYKTVDKWRTFRDGADNAITTTQHALTSSDTGPWEEGFRYSLHLENGNQTGGADSGDRSEISHTIESQYVAQSGWNYLSASSYITLSFWVRSSVAQDFKGYLYSNDGTPKSYPFATGSLSANTWTKITKKIPGNSGLQFDDNNESGLYIGIQQYMGTDKTSSVTENAWMTYASGDRTADQTSTWWTTNDATWEITGVQLEVGEVATLFEHRLYDDELRRCQRYYFEVKNGFIGGARGGSGGSLALWSYPLPTPLRASPTITALTSFSMRAFSSAGNSDSTATPSVATNGWTKDACHLYVSQGSHSIVDDRVASVQQSNGIALEADV